MLAVIKQQLKKRNNKKGFTLVEVIVVLVILAILAAIAIPALTGYIDKANQRTVISEAQSCRTALQAIGTDAYGNGATDADIDKLVAGDTQLSVLGTGKYNPVGDGTTVKSEIAALTKADMTDVTISGITWDGSALTGFVYDNNKYTATLANGSFTVDKD